MVPQVGSGRFGSGLVESGWIGLDRVAPRRAGVWPGLAGLVGFGCLDPLVGTGRAGLSNDFDGFVGSELQIFLLYYQCSTFSIFKKIFLCNYEGMTTVHSHNIVLYFIAISRRTHLYTTN